MAWYNPPEVKQRNALLIAIVLLLLIYPFYHFWYQGRRAEVTAIQEHLEKLEADNRRAGVLAARGGGDLEERMALYARQVGKLEELIPAAEEVPALLDDMSVRARREGVEVNRLLPEPSEAGAYYTKTSYQVAVVGDYHSVGRFLAEVASLSRIVKPVELDVEPHPQPQLYPDIDAPVLASFRIETYVLPEPGAAGPPPTEAGG